MGLAGNRAGASRRCSGTSVSVRSDDMAGGGLGKPGRGNPTTVRASVPVRASGRSDGNKGCVSTVTQHIGNGALWKAVAPARCFGIEGHVGNRMHGFETLGGHDHRASGESGGQKVRGRRSWWCRRFASAGLRSGGARLRSGLEQGVNGFGRLASPSGSMGESPESERSPREHRANQSRQRGRRATDFWRGNPCGGGDFWRANRFRLVCRTEEGQPREGQDIR